MESKNLLVAHPLLWDGYFRRAVIFLTFPEGPEGAMGFVLNFRTNLFLRDVRPGLKRGNFPIYSGGPVATNNLFFFHNLGDKISESNEIAPNVFFGGNFDELIDLIEMGMVSDENLRLFIGYSGWSEGQLSEEIKNNAWFTTHIQEQELLKPMGIDAWAEYLYRIKRSLRIFGLLGYDVCLN